jgi:hypothetical protein
MWNLANMYASGQMGAPDLVSACVWTLRAQRYALPTDRDVRERSARVTPFLEHNLSAGEMASCRQQAADWRPQKKGGDANPTGERQRT